MIIEIFLLTLISLFILAFSAYRVFMWPQSKFFGKSFCGINTDKKIIALSFDDGPTSPYTNELMAVLDKHQVKATFFLVGRNLEKYPEIAKKLFVTGHTIGNHAFKHRLPSYLTAPSLREEVLKTQEIIYKLINKKPTLFRPPWLIRNRALFRMIKENNLTLISGIFGTQKEVWEVSSEVIYNDAIKQIAPGRILIFHDGIIKSGSREGTVRAVDMLISELKKQGYEFVTVDQLLDIPAYQ